MDTHSIKTPFYVLLDGKQRLGPKLLASHAGPEFKAIYGFSNREAYDLFCAKSDHSFIPYPLVKGYLQNQIADSGDTVQLVVVDPTGPQQAHLNAATMNSILEAVNQKATQVTLSFRLTLDPALQAYCIEKASSGLELTKTQ